MESWDTLIQKDGFPQGRDSTLVRHLGRFSHGKTPGFGPADVLPRRPQTSVPISERGAEVLS